MTDPARSGALFRVKDSACLKSPLPKFHNIETSGSAATSSAPGHELEFTTEAEGFRQSFSKMVAQYGEEGEELEELLFQENVKASSMEEEDDDEDDARLDDRGEKEEGSEPLVLREDPTGGDIIIHGHPEGGKHVAVSVGKKANVNTEPDQGSVENLRQETVVVMDAASHLELPDHQDIEGGDDGADQKDDTEDIPISDEPSADYTPEPEEMPGRENVERIRACEMCGKPALFGSGRFCSKSCACKLGAERSRKARRSTVFRRKPKKKSAATVRRKSAPPSISSSRNRDGSSVCAVCQKTHDGTYGNGKYCSKKCRYQWRQLTPPDKRKSKARSPLNVRSPLASAKNIKSPSTKKACEVCGKPALWGSGRFCGRPCAAKSSAIKQEKIATPPSRKKMRRARPTPPSTSATTTKKKLGSSPSWRKRVTKKRSSKPNVKAVQECEVCGEPATWGTGRFCGRPCAAKSASNIKQNKKGRNKTSSASSTASSSRKIKVERKSKSPRHNKRKAGDPACERCGKPALFGKGRFCSRSCAGGARSNKRRKRRASTAAVRKSPNGKKVKKETLEKKLSRNQKGSGPDDTDDDDGGWRDQAELQEELRAHLAQGASPTEDKEDTPAEPSQNGASADQDEPELDFDEESEEEKDSPAVETKAMVEGSSVDEDAARKGTESEEQQQHQEAEESGKAEIESKPTAKSTKTKKSSIKAKKATSSLSRKSKSKNKKKKAQAKPKLKIKKEKSVAKSPRSSKKDRKKAKVATPEPKIQAEKIALGYSRSGRLVMKPLNWWDNERVIDGVVLCDPVKIAEENAEALMREKHGISNDFHSPYLQRTRDATKASRKETKKKRIHHPKSKRSGARTKAKARNETDETELKAKRPRRKRKVPTDADHEVESSQSSNRARRDYKDARHGKETRRISSTGRVPRSSMDAVFEVDRDERIKKNKQEKAASRKLMEEENEEQKEKEEEKEEGEEIEVGDDGWSAKQTKQLLEAHTQVEPSPRFWSVVAKKVSGKGSRECAEKYNTLFPTPSRAKRKGNKRYSSKDEDKKAALYKTLALPKGRAPVKRIKAYRSVLRMADDAHGADDYFTSTPNRAASEKKGAGSLDVGSPPDVEDSPYESDEEPRSGKEDEYSLGAYERADHDKADSHINKLKKTIRSQNYRHRRVVAKKRRQAKRTGVNPEDLESEEVAAKASHKIYYATIENIIVSNSNNKT
uniref:Myb-like domain-containing protein n=1 Tax=Lotharella globosa TaxID=91324 RepID=A0A7S4DQA7_9EUKA